MKAALLAAAVLATAGVVFYFGTAVHAAKVSGAESAPQSSAAHKALSSTSLSLPLFFEPNQGQTAPQVKFLARGSGYGLFLTGDEAVLELQRSTPSPFGSGQAKNSREPWASSSVIRMRLDGANSSALVSGTSPLPGKSSYFIGSDPSQWHHDIPQFGRVEYKSVYPGVNLVYYGNQGQLEYDFRVAPGADPNQIALGFQGASTSIDAGDSGDLILSTANGEVRFHSPRIYQQDGNNQKPVAGSFRQIAENKIGFTVGAYDHSRELVIDPVLSYSTYLGGTGGSEGLVKIAIDPGDLMYVAGSTTSPNFPTVPVGNSSLTGTQNIFISKIDLSQTTTAQQLVYSIYLGGELVDSLAGIAVDRSANIYVAGSTTSQKFPTVNGIPSTVGGGISHGFVSAITLNSVTTEYSLAYSTYLAGNGADTVTGLAVDNNQNAYVTGDTTSSNTATTLAPFPASPNGYQTSSNNSGNPQFFASEIDTTGTGATSMRYSTYFGGGYPTTATATGGGIAVDPGGTTVNMYITGTTNMRGEKGPSGEPAFPLLNAQQSCLNESGNHGTCASYATTPITDGFVAKINPNPPGGAASLIYSTYIGGADNDTGVAIAVDSTSAYVTGTTYSTDWVCTTSCPIEYQATNGGAGDAYIAKIGPLSGSWYPLNYFTYLGGAGLDSGQDIKVDSAQKAFVVGYTYSTNFPTANAYQSQCGGFIQTGTCSGDAFVAAISTSLGGTMLNPAGDYATYLGGGELDQGTGIAIDGTLGTAFVAGTTQSSPASLPPFPITPNAYQTTLNGTPDAFVSTLAANTVITVTVPTTVAGVYTSPTPNPVPAGTQIAFTFDVTNTGYEQANLVTFYAYLPTTGLTTLPTATQTGGTGNCTLQATTMIFTCMIGSLPVNGKATVVVDMTPASPIVNQTITVSGNASANGGPVGPIVEQPVANVVDFSIDATTPAPITDGDTATITVTFCPTDTTLGYSGTITPATPTFNPSMVTASTPTYSPTTVVLSGGECYSTKLSIATVARPVTTGSLFRRGSGWFYAAWLPIGGLSLLGLGIGAGRKRRRWLAGAVLGLIAGAILLQSACGSSGSTIAPGGGTLAGTYAVTITGTAASSASHAKVVYLTVN